MDFGLAPIRQRAHIKAERLRCRIKVVPCQGRQIPPVPATGATPTRLHDELPLPLLSPRLLARIVLMAGAGVAVLAPA